MPISKRHAVALAAAGLLPVIAAQDISSGCLSFLADLDNDVAVKGCTAGLLKATAQFNPVGNEASDATLSGIKSTLATVCSHSVDFCPSATIQAALTEFSGNCSSELAGPSAVASVVSLYDAIYVLSPLRSAMCSTNPATSNSCLLEIAGVSGTDAAPASNDTPTSSNATAALPSGADVASNSIQSNRVIQYSQAIFNIKDYAADALIPQFLYQAASSVSTSARRLLRRQNNSASQSASGSSSSAPSASSTGSKNNAPSGNDDSDISEVVASATTFNATTFTNSNLLFLFLSPDMPTKQLCTDCTKQVFASYVAWESAFPYGSGLSNSALLGGQPAFWKAMGATCGSGFLTSINTIAGQTNIDSAAAFNVPTKGVIAVLAFAATFFAMI